MAVSKNIRSDLSRAKGHGSSGEGAITWLHERITSVTSLFLVGWFLVSMLMMPDWSYETVLEWAGNPVNAFLLILTTISVFYHASLGCLVIVEDYVHNKAFKFVKVWGIKLFFLTAGIAAIFCIMLTVFQTV